MLLLILAAACSQPHYSVAPPPTPCQEVYVRATGIPGAQDQYGGVILTCNGSQAFISSGATGSNGVDGYSLVSEMLPASPEECPSGGTLILVAQDSDRDGQLSAHDRNIQSTLVCNGATGSVGATGAQGEAGQNAVLPPMTVVSAIAPCGYLSSPWKEEILCLNDGSLLADFSASLSGAETRFSFIGAGSYVDTDESGCQFNVTVDTVGNHSVSWSAGSNVYSTWFANSITCQKNN